MGYDGIVYTVKYASTYLSAVGVATHPVGHFGVGIHAPASDNNDVVGAAGGTHGRVVVTVDDSATVHTDHQHSRNNNND